MTDASMLSCLVWLHVWFKMKQPRLIGLQRVSFRSVKEAVEAAEDGDQIILLPGIHNGMG